MQTIQIENKIVRSENFITATVDNDIVMMSLEKGAYFGLDDIGSTIWEQIGEPKRVSTICTHLISQFEVDQSQCEADVLAFLNDLAAEGMVQIVG